METIISEILHKMMDELTADQSFMLEEIHQSFLLLLKTKEELHMGKEQSLARLCFRIRREDE